MADYENQDAGYDEGRSYDRRDRSASPRGDREDRQRSRSPNGRAPPPPPVDKRMTDIQDEEGALNPGTNLFVTGIHPRLTEQDVIQLFEKYGEVENCSIMLDPHTKESRGFGFVRMVLPDQADAAREGLQGVQIEGRTLSIEKARRGRPRTPTPGKYFGPPKRGDFGGGRGGRGGFGGRDRYDDRRGYRDDYRRGPPRDYGRYDDRGYGGGRRDRDDGYGGSSRIDRYESGGGGGGSGGSRREDGYGRDRRGGYESRGDDRGDRGGDRGYGGAPARDDGPRDYSSGGREYTRSGDDGYGRR